MIPKIRVFAKAGVKSVFGGGYDTDQMFYEIRDIDFYDKEVTVWGCHHKDCGMCDDTYRIEDVEIMMSTGLKDKNGVEIYDRDIVQVEEKIVISGKMTSIKVNKVVKYREDYAQFLLYANENGEHLTFAKFGEVIGNIYENKGLLEAVK